MMEAMTPVTERLLELAALAKRTEDGGELYRLLREGHLLYHQGLAETRHDVAHRYEGRDDLAAACRRQGVPRGADDTSGEAVNLLAFARWAQTPAALAFDDLAEDAARRGVCLLPES